MNNLTYDDLFAYRLQLLDQTNDEYSIINRLKYRILSAGVQHTEMNEILHNFYLIYNIPIAPEYIENAQSQMHFASNIEELTAHNLPDEADSNDENDANEDFAETERIFINIMPLFINIGMFNSLHNFININGPNMENVTVTTDKKSLDRIQKNIITPEMKETCTICMDDMKIGDEYYNLSCRHVFHTECINEYLLNYNHVCPLCKEEIGDKQINI